VLKLRVLVLAAVVSAAVAALWPAAGTAATLKGVVVAREHGTMLVASAAGHVRAVRGAASVGSRVTVGSAGATVVGRATRAHLRGIVLRHVGRTMFIASDRHLLALHSTDTTPAPPGTVISAQVGIANGQLDEQDEDDVGQVANGTITVQAIVTAVAAGSVTLTVEGQSLTVSLPGGLTLPASLVGQTVTIQLSVAGNADDDQGDDNHGDGDHGGHGGGGDG
jgi:hypothetical protein